jgi:hypothetical protein
MSPSLPRAPGPHAHTVFLNFDGATLNPTEDGDARKDLSDIINDTALVPAFNSIPYGGPGAAEQISLLVQQLFAAYDLKVVNTRPTDTDQYVMVMLGGLPDAVGAPDSARGYAPLDCDDANPHDVVFVFSEALGDDFGDDSDAARRALAAVAAQETAHAYGLVHTDNVKDVMYPYVVYPVHDRYFAQGNVVGRACQSSTFQDSAKMMMNVLGPHVNNE